MACKFFCDNCGGECNEYSTLTGEVDLNENKLGSQPAKETMTIELSWRSIVVAKHFSKKQLYCKCCAKAEVMKFLKAWGFA